MGRQREGGTFKFHNRLTAMKGIPLLLALYHGAASDEAQINWGTEAMKMSSTGPDNTLPNFLFMAAGEEGGSIWGGDFDYRGGSGTPSPWSPPNACPDDLFNNTSNDLRVPQLPWQLQDDWGCEREPDDADVIVVENDYLRAAITPQWGGKIWSLYDKKKKRQLFFNNPAHQPNNIGYRKAWASGGCEWNWSPGKIGHSVFSESPVFTGILHTEKGDVVRVWEYDRQNHTVWSVDIFLEEDVLWAHPRVTNPGDVDLEGYWWTCVAMRVEDDTRIVTPADESVTPCAPWPRGNVFPVINDTFHGSDYGGYDGCSTRAGAGNGGACAWQPDQSFIGNIPSSHDYFMRINTTEHANPYIATADGDGFVVIHSHSPKLLGTKFFTWGMTERGSFQMDFMSAADYQNEACGQEAYDPWCDAYEHVGRYAELQIGPAPTQMHTFPLPQNSSFEWTEWFKSFIGDPEKLHATNYDEALAEVEEWQASDDGMTQSKIDEMDAFFESIAATPPNTDDIWTQGMPWGGLREGLTGSLLAPGCPFPEPVNDERTRPWLDLLHNGTFSAETLLLTPINFEVDEKWVSLLQSSAETYGDTWLHNLFLGTHALEVGNSVDARSFFRKSIELAPSAHAERALALLAENATDGISHYDSAWDLWTGLDLDADPAAERLGKDLAVEYSGWLMMNEQWERLRTFLEEDLTAKSVPSSFALKDVPLHATAALALNDKDYQTTLDIVTTNCFPTYGSVRQDLINLHFDAQLMKAEDAKGSPLTRLEIVHLRQRFRCDGDNTQLTYDSSCINGPPNLGSAYG